MKGTLSKQVNNTMSIIRIAPICNGKVYLTPRPTVRKTLVMDVPIEEHVEQWSAKSKKAIQEIKERYSENIHSIDLPRFCAQYKSTVHPEATVYLYVLPLKQEDEIHFHDGQFIPVEEISKDMRLYSRDLQEESELLCMASELWNDYFTATNKKGME